MTGREVRPKILPFNNPIGRKKFGIFKIVYNTSGTTDHCAVRMTVWPRQANNNNRLARRFKMNPFLNKSIVSKKALVSDTACITFKNSKFRKKLTVYCQPLILNSG